MWILPEFFLKGMEYWYMPLHEDEPQKQYAKWKKPVTKDYMLYDPIYVKCSEEANL